MHMSDGAQSTSAPHGMPMVQPAPVGGAQAGGWHVHDVLLQTSDPQSVLAEQGLMSWQVGAQFGFWHVPPLPPPHCCEAQLWSLPAHGVPFGQLGAQAPASMGTQIPLVQNNPAGL